MRGRKAGKERDDDILTNRWDYKTCMSVWMSEKERGDCILILHSIHWECGGNITQQSLLLFHFISFLYKYTQTFHTNQHHVILKQHVLLRLLNMYNVNLIRINVEKMWTEIVVSICIITLIIIRGSLKNVLPCKGSLTPNSLRTPGV